MSDPSFDIGLEDLDTNTASDFDVYRTCGSDADSLLEEPLLAFKPFETNANDIKEVIENKSLKLGPVDLNGSKNLGFC